MRGSHEGGVGPHGRDREHCSLILLATQLLLNLGLKCVVKLTADTIGPST